MRFLVNKGKLLTAKKYTILVIPEGSHRVRRFALKINVLRGIGVSFAVLFLVVCGFLTDYALTSFDQHEFNRLQAETLAQKNQIRDLSASLDSVQQELLVLAQNDAKVRVLANLTKPKIDGLTGVGGPLASGSEAEYPEIQQKIDRIREAIDLRRKSQEEVQGILNDQRSLLAAKPSGLPTRGWTTSSFGMRLSPFTGKRSMHDGLDIAARTGTPVQATADGIVSRVVTDPGYGKLVVIEHGYGYRTYYGHNSKIFVKVGQRVKRGETISAVGNTGRSTGSHVHYEVRLNGVPLNPKKFT